MAITTGPNVGRFSIEIELTNDLDLGRAESGDIAQDKVRKTVVRGVVDSGATRLVIPESVAKALGLKIVGSTKVRNADQRLADRDIAERIRLSYGGRGSV